MPSTKIINVLKNDSFPDVMAALQETDAKEIIFIFPKGSKFSKNEKYFEKINDHAIDSGQRVSIMTSDPVLALCAQNLGMHVLDNPHAKAASTPKKAARAATPEPAQLVADWQNDILEDETTPKAEDEEALPTDSQETDVDTALNDYFKQDEDEDEEEEIAADDDLKDEETSYPELEEEKEDDMVDEPVADLTGLNETLRPFHDIKQQRGESSLRIKQGKERPEDIFVNVQKKSVKSLDNQLSAMWGQRPDDARPLASVAPGRFADVAVAKGRSFLKRAPFLYVGAALVVTGLVMYSILGTAAITIKPVKQALNVQLKVSASTDTPTVNTQFNRIPGQRFVDEQEVSGTFPASGNKESASKASGTVTIYNKSSTAQRLVATTRLESDSGQIFRIPVSISVPGATKKGTEIIPGSITATVYADRPGPDFNIPAAKFTIPGFKGTDKYDQFYAVSAKATTGGSLGPSKAVTEADYTKAKTDLTAQLQTKIQEALKGQASELTIVDNPTIAIGEPSSNAKPDDAADSLQMTVKGSLATIAFKESDIKELIKSYISKNGNLEIIEKDLEISYKDPILTNDDKTLTFTLSATGQAAHILDKDKIGKEILGMKEKNIQAYFKTIKEIESVRIVLSPFWVKSIPKDPTKVTLSVEI